MQTGLKFASHDLYHILRQIILNFKVQNSFQNKYKFVFQTSKDNLLKLIYDRLIAPHESTLSDSVIEGLRRLCYEKKYAHITPDFNLLREGFMPNCSISLIPEAFIRGMLAIPLAKKSPYLGLLNHK